MNDLSGNFSLVPCISQTLWTKFGELLHPAPGRNARPGEGSPGVTGSLGALPAESWRPSAAGGASAARTPNCAHSASVEADPFDAFGEGRAVLPFSICLHDLTFRDKIGQGTRNRQKPV